MEATRPVILPSRPHDPRAVAGDGWVSKGKPATNDASEEKRCSFTGVGPRSRIAGEIYSWDAQPVSGHAKKARPAHFGRGRVYAV